MELCMITFSGVVKCFGSLASLAGSAVEHRINRARVFLGGCVLFGFGCGGGGLGGHDAALFLFDVDGGFLDVRRLEGAEVVGGFEALVPGSAIHVAEGLHLGGGEEEVDALGLVDPLLAAGGGVDDVFEVDAEDGLVLVFEGFWNVADGV